MVLDRCGRAKRGWLGGKSLKKAITFVSAVAKKNQ
jgi:hypothetical protein